MSNFEHRKYLSSLLKKFFKIISWQHFYAAVEVKQKILSLSRIANTHISWKIFVHYSKTSNRFHTHFLKLGRKVLNIYCRTIATTKRLLHMNWIGGPRNENFNTHACLWKNHNFLTIGAFLPSINFQALASIPQPQS